jgi:hypothetical protein
VSERHTNDLLLLMLVSFTNCVWRGGVPPCARGLDLHGSSSCPISALQRTLPSLNGVFEIAIGTGGARMAFTFESKCYGEITPGSCRSSSNFHRSEKNMRNIVFGMLAVAGLGFATLPAVGAPLGSTAPGAETSLVQQTQGWSFCRRLRRACEFKHERGQAGEGNCARYRRHCGSFGYRDDDRRRR